jgi:hypothetical protein
MDSTAMRGSPGLVAFRQRTSLRGPYRARSRLQLAPPAALARLTAACWTSRCRSVQFELLESLLKGHTCQKTVSRP